MQHLRVSNASAREIELKLALSGRVVADGFIPRRTRRLVPSDLKRLDLRSRVCATRSGLSNLGIAAFWH
jgi:hypothetical protein